MGRRNSSRAGLLNESSSISSTITTVKVAVIGRAKKRSARPQMSCSSPKMSKKRSTRPLMSCFLPKISLKQWRYENFQKGSHNSHIFLIVFLFGRTIVKLIGKQERI